jgi:hypothetical protein
LPAFIALSTTVDQLAAHALVVAREEVLSGSASGWGILDRQAFLQKEWLPQMQARQAALMAITSEREQRASAEAQAAARASGIEQKIQAVETDFAKQADAERAKTAPILPQ